MTSREVQILKKVSKPNKCITFNEKSQLYNIVLNVTPRKGAKRKVVNSPGFSSPDEAAEYVDPYVCMVERGLHSGVKLQRSQLKSFKASVYDKENTTICESSEGTNMTSLCIVKKLEFKKMNKGKKDSLDRIDRIEYLEERQLKSFERFRRMVMFKVRTRRTPDGWVSSAVRRHTNRVYYLEHTLFNDTCADVAKLELCRLNIVEAINKGDCARYIQDYDIVIDDFELQNSGNDTVESDKGILSDTTKSDTDDDDQEVNYTATQLH